MLKKITQWRDLIVKVKWKGFQRYLYKIILSNVLLVLIPVCILGIFWYGTVAHQAEQKFEQQKSIEINEIVSGIKQRIKNINLELAVENTDEKYSTYTFSDTYIKDLYMISHRLSTMIRKYPLLYSVYFYDRRTGKIYSSKSGKYLFSEFYDTKWMENINEICIVQQLPLRYTFDDETLLTRFPTVYLEYNQLVLTLVLKGNPDYFLVANISIKSLFNDIVHTYELYNKSQEFFFIDTEGRLIEGKCEYISPELLLNSKAKSLDHDVSYVKKNDRIYFINQLDCGITCVSSYPLDECYKEAQYLGKYVMLVCIGLFFFLLMVSTYMAKKLYQPINTLYSDITEGTKSLQKENVHDEIEMLKQVFMEMNTFNSNAKLNMKHFEEISKTFRFRNFLEHYQSERDFLSDHPYLFPEDGDGMCELIVLKIATAELGMSAEEETLFRMNLQEVLRTYLQSSMKGILTNIEDDTLVLLYLGNEKEDLEQTKTVLTDTVVKLTKKNAYFAISKPIRRVEEILPQFHTCMNLLETSYFFGWRNEVITEDLIKVQDSEDIYNMLLNLNTAFIRSIVSQNKDELDSLLRQLEQQLRQMQNASQAKDICNRIIVDLDREFHFSKSLEHNLLQALNDNKTLVDMIDFIKRLIDMVSKQYGSNDAKESNYCEQAKNYLESNYMRDMNITDVADHLDISYSYLSKIFRTRTGVTLTDYLNSIRIEKSKDYLANTFLTLLEISEKVGYNNVQSYQRFFKKYVNMTPGDYRKLHSNQFK
jgi:two-component system response regulator YesN